MVDKEGCEERAGEAVAREGQRPEPLQQRSQPKQHPFIPASTLVKMEV